MEEKPDAQLLRDYAERRKEAAFCQIVIRHTDLVYFAALRQVGSPDLAKDIAQSVFVDLAHKAKTIADRLPENASLIGWLYRSTRYAALNHLRNDRRRLAQESQAMQQLLTHSESAPDWEQIHPILDEAMAGLNDDEREAVLLRYFKSQDFRAVGLALGVSDDTAQKRVSRAVERLREFFSKRNVTIGAGGLTVLISANAVQSAPMGLAAAISTAAVLTGTAAQTSSAVAATKTIAMTTLQKTLVTVTVAVLAGVGVYKTHQTVQLRDQVKKLQQQQAPLAEQIQHLQSERDKAMNRAAWLAEQFANDKKNNLKLLKLRGEVTQLKHESQELVALKAKLSQGPLASESNEEAWLKRIQLLKQRMAQTPSAEIPELQYLNEDDWIRAAKHELKTEADYQAALSKLDASAEVNFLGVVETALHKYLAANNGQFPSAVTQLKPYFTNAPSDTLLQRYQIVPTDTVPQANLAGNAGDYAITPKYPANDALLMLTTNGVGSTSYSDSKLMDVLVPAIKALYAATPWIDGKRQIDLHQLPPYLTTPEQKQAYKELMEQEEK